MTSPNFPVRDDDGDYPSPIRAWWVVATMFAASIVSVIDRGILTLMVDPVRKDLAISDVQMSLLLGVAFGLFYAVAGVPLGLLADRFSRRRLLVLGIAVWSAATFFGGLSASFGELFAARLLVGLGEAALAPCAVSLIGDMFPPDRRGRPISVYLLGQSLAGGLSVMLTGAIISAVPAGRLAWIGWFDGLAAWRVAFLIAGMSGIPVILMLMTFREPVRRGAKVSRGRTPIISVIGYLRRNWKVFLPFYAGFSMLVMMSYSIGAWSSTYLMRQFALQPSDVGKWQGSVGIVLGTSGALLAGFIVDAVSRHARPGGKLIYLASVAFFMFPAALLVFMPTAATAILSLGFIAFFMPMVGTGMVTTVQEMVPSDMRGISVSLFGLFNTITGQSLGPFLVALIADHYTDSGPYGLGIAMTIVCLPALACATLLFALAFIGYRKILNQNGELHAVLRSNK
jgi:MFS family permease